MFRPFRSKGYVKFSGFLERLRRIFRNFFSSLSEMKDVITGWIKNIFAAILPEQLGQGAQAFEKKVKPRLIDVTDGVSLTEEAQKKSLELLSMIRRSGSHIDNLRLAFDVRRRTKKSLADFYDMPEIMDEVTEKLIEVAKEDKRVRKIFG